ncbi:MAG: hypothetical protein HYZ48_04170, partial [Chlamydiales bacterium]|nr:hypothetical protein [Chlamydiales bacterium]
RLFGIARLLFFSIIAAFLAISLHRFIGADTPLLFLSVPFFLLGINWGLSNSGLITAVNQVISLQKIAEALGTLATIWNVVGSLLLATSTAVFHANQTDSSFLYPYHRVIDFNILFAFLVLLASLRIHFQMKKS